MNTSIANVAHVASGESSRFVPSVQQAINSFQADGYEVEVQYSVAGLSHYQNVHYSALVIARKPSS